MADDIQVSFSAENNIEASFAAANPITAATQAQVNTGTATDVYVNPATFAGASKWDTKINHALATAANDFLVASGNGVFVKKTLAEVLTILKLWNSGTLPDGATIAADCDDYKQFAWYLTTVETATAITFYNVGVVVDLSIKKQGTDDLVITLAGTGLVFDIYDSTNKCYTEGTTVTLSRAVANTTFKLNFVVTGLIRDSDTVVQVAGTFTSFA